MLCSLCAWWEWEQLIAVIPLSPLNCFCGISVEQCGDTGGIRLFIDVSEAFQRVYPANAALTGEFSPDERH